MAGPPFKKPGCFRSSLRVVSAIALIGGYAFAAPSPVIDRETAQPVTNISSEELESLPANRDFRAILDVHNRLRAEVGARPLRWNRTLADNAQQYANALAETGTRQHSSRVGRENERENIVVGPRSGISPIQMVQIWVKERRAFRPGTFPNVCVGDWTVCGHYTQMIWPTTTDIGCGVAKGRFDALVCRYSPPGNRDGVAIGPGMGTRTRLAGGLCTSPGGETIPCGNEDGGEEMDSGVKEEDACVVDVNLHRPISLAPDEPIIPDATELTPGATTLRNDDSDWRLGQEPAASELPIVSLPADVDRAQNGNENDLVKVDAINPAGLPGVYVFAFPTHAEADRNLDTQVQPVAGGRHATVQELGYFTAATKAAPAPALPLIIPAGPTSFWVEAKLGGRYRLVIGKLAVGVAPGDVRYDRDTGAAYAMKEKNRVPAFICEDQATLTAAVVDIFQRRARNAGPQRLTAFDVYWAGRPHFRAAVWPGGEAFSWGEQYRLGPNLHAMPGAAVKGTVASMAKDAEDAKNDNNARLDGPNVSDKGKAPGNFNVKGRIEGGFQIDNPQANNVPTVNANAANRYPDRVSLEYLVNGERLVRPEYLQVILPQIRAPAAPARPAAGSTTSVSSGVSYTIVDGFNRVIKVGKDETIADYLYLYGAGIKAWEALSGQDGRVVESGPTLDGNGQPKRDRYNDHLFITNTGLDGNGEQRPPIGPLGTAQRSQARVHANRMTEGIFQDTLIFNAGSDVNARQALWRAATGREGANEAQRREPLRLAKQEATDRDRSVRQGDDIRQADQRRIGSFSVMAIPQDVILQLRVGAARHDLMVFQNNMLSVLAPYFFEDTQYPGNKDDGVFRYHIQFTPGAATSQLVLANHRRP